MNVLVPVVSKRLDTLDFMRGIFILGILLANITAFGRHGNFAEILSPFQPIRWSEIQLENWLNFLVSGKFRSMLCILFGVGLCMQMSKRSVTAHDAVNKYSRRMVILFAIGVFHGIFIWFGDILAIYAVVGLIAALMVNQSPKTLTGIIIGCAILSVIISIIMIGSMSAMGSTAGLESILKFFSAQNELRIFQQGTYGEQILMRSVVFVIAGLSSIFLLPALLGLFLLGTKLAQIGAIQNPKQHLPLLKKLIGYGLGLGIPLNFSIFFANTSQSRYVVQSLIELIFGPVLAVGLFASVLLLAHEVSHFRISSLLVKIGRMSLSVYLLQSLLCTFYFYSWGLKKFGTHSLQDLFLVVFVVWILCGCFAWLWLRRFDIGPVEWLWRSWDGKRKLPWKNPTPPTVQES